MSEPRLPPLGGALPTQALPLAPDVPAFVHHHEPHPGADRLVIGLAGLHLDAAAPRTAWPYRPRLAQLPVHRLFVDPQSGDPDSLWLDIEPLSRFLAAARAAIGVTPERTVVCGSSLGATVAVLTAVRAGFGHVLAGSPIVRLGEYLTGEDAPAVVRAAASGRARSPEDLARLDRLVIDAVLGRATPMRLDLFFGEADPLHRSDFPALRDVCMANDSIDLRVKTQPGVSHHNAYRPWSRHMSEVLRSVLAGG